MKRELFKINGYIFGDTETAEKIEDEFFDWLQSKGYYFGGTINQEKDEINLENFSK